MINIDLDNLNEEVVYKAFQVDGKESEALNDSYRACWANGGLKMRVTASRINLFYSHTAKAGVKVVCLHTKQPTPT